MEFFSPISRKGQRRQRQKNAPIAQLKWIIKCCILSIADCICSPELEWEIWICFFLVFRFNVFSPHFLTPYSRIVLFICDGIPFHAKRNLSMYLIQLFSDFLSLLFIVLELRTHCTRSKIIRIFHAIKLQALCKEHAVRFGSAVENQLWNE